jgi:hypothetical protein
MIKHCERSPPSHDVTVTAENLCQTAHNNVGVGEHIDVDEVTDTLVDYDTKIVFVGEAANALKVWCPEEWVGWKLGEQCHKSFASFKPLFQIIELFRRPKAIEF